MLLILLKSAACLAIFMVFYKLFLERENMHQFKRFYLLAALIVSFVIPFITFIKYVEPALDFGYYDTNAINTPPYFPAEIPLEEEPINYLPIMLWSIYGLGVLLFGAKFCLNLFGIVSKINRNEKQKHPNFISVLLNDLIVPHTFFSYIFLNKTKFEAKAIPQEVLLHEQAHAKQKHSLDILFIELLQVIFWFNPLLYFIKKDIKLNHEFLADQAVLKHGTDSSTYQNMLLAFSTNATEPELANAINYSLIKKRFNIMKTQTSKKAVWLRSLLLLPLLGGLLFSFSSIKEVEKEIVPKISDKEIINSSSDAPINHTARSISIKVSSDGAYEIDGIKANKNTFKKVINQLHQDITPEIRNNIINIHVDSPKNISDKEVWFIYNAVLDYGFHRIVAYNQEIIRAKGNTPFAIENNKGKEYSGNNTDYSTEKIQDPILIINGIACERCELNLTKKGVEGIILSTDTGENILSFKFKVPGKASVINKGDALNPKSVDLLKNLSLGASIQLFDIKTVTKTKLPPVIIKLVDKYDKTISKSPVVRKGEKSSLPPPPPPPAPIKEYKQMKKKYNKMTAKSKENLPPPPPPAPKVIKGQASNIPPPPPPPPAPKSPIDQVVLMAKKGADFYYNAEKIASDKAIEIVKNNSKLNLSMHTNNGKSTVHLSNKPISIVNGRATIYQEKKEEALKRSKVMMKEREKKLKEMKKEREMMLKERKEKKEEVLQRSKAMLKEREGKLKELKEKREMMYKERRQYRKSLAEQFKGMEAQGSVFFFEGKKISEDKAIALIKENPKLNVSMHSDNGKGTVHLSKKGIQTVNGKLVKKEK